MATLDTLIPLASPVVLLILKAALVVAAAALACVLLLGRASAALRHGVWSAALAIVLALPLLTAAPGWSVRVIPAADAKHNTTVAQATAPPSNVADDATEKPPADAAGVAQDFTPRMAEPTDTTPVVASKTTAPTRDKRTDAMHGAGRPSIEIPAATAAIAGSIEDPPYPSTPPPLPTPAHDPTPGAGAAQTGRAPAGATPTTATPSPAWPLWLAGVWVVGGVIAAMPLAVGLVRLRIASRTARCLDDQPGWAQTLKQTADRVGLPRPVRLLASGRTDIPVTFGLVRPTVLLPAGCDDWDAERRAMVLMHELAHIRRGDWGWMLLARLAVAVHWFNPLVRFGARRLHTEAERAADDIVLTGGCAASAYAACLYLMVCTDRTPRATSAALPLGRGADITRRLQMILSETNNRRPMDKRLSWWTGLTVIALALPVGLVQLAVAQEETAADAPATTGESAYEAHDAAVDTAPDEPGQDAPDEPVQDAAAEDHAHDVAVGEHRQDAPADAATADNPLIGTWRIVHMPVRGDLPDDLPRDADGHLRMFFDFDAEGRATFRAPDGIEAARYRIDPVKRQIVVYQEGQEDRPELVDTYSFSDNGRGLTLQPSGLVLERYGDDPAHTTPASPARLLGTWEVRDPDGEYEGAIRFHENGTAEIWEDEDGHPADSPPQTAVRYAVGEGTLDLIMPDGDTDRMILLIQGPGRMYMDEYALVRIDATLGTVTTRAGARDDSTAPVDEYARKVIQALFEKRVSIEIQEVPFSEVISFLHETTGANIFINTRSLENKGVGMDDLVTMKLDDVKALTVLELAIDLISDDIELDYKDTVLIIE